MANDGTTQTAGDGGSATRRNVLKGGAVAVGAFIAFEAIGGVSLAAGTTPKSTMLANGVIFPDPTLCIGCLTCEVICSRVHKEQGLSDLPRIRIFNDPTTQVDPAVQAQYPGRGQFHQEPCLQCPTAECLYVCPVNALRVAPNGARVINEDVCVACNRCAEACIFPVSPEQNATNGLVFNQESRISYDPVRDNFTKCDLCYWRDGTQKGFEGSGPACAQQCPINIRIEQGILKLSDPNRRCLAVPQVNDHTTWDKLKSFQQFAGAPSQDSKATA